MFRCLLIGCEKGGMEDGVNFLPRGDVEVEGCVGYYFLYLKGTHSFHLEFLGSVHVEVSGLEADSVSYFPESKLGGYLFLHLLLGHLVHSLSLVTCRG